MMRIAIGIFIAALAATPVVAAETAQPDLARWVANNTDLQATNVAIAGPDNIYSVERLGPPAPTGEVIALVRAERLKADWSKPHGFGSWDAHVIFDCKAERMRVIRSASYADPNREGEATAESKSQDWFTPRPDEPSARLLSAACDTSYDWPLRAKITVARAPTAPIIEEGAPRKAPIIVEGEPSAADSAGADKPAVQTATPAENADGAGKPAVELAQMPVERPMSVLSAEAAPVMELAAADLLEPPSFTQPSRSPPTVRAIGGGKRGFAALFSPFEKVAALGRRLFTPSSQFAAKPQQPRAMQHAMLGEEATKKVANFARAGPGLE
jgi:hypothetical protein